MTQLRFTFLLAFSLLFIACKNIDQVLVGEIQNRNAEFESLKGEYNDFFSAVGKHSEAIHQVSDGVKADSGYVEMVSMVETLTGKGNNRVNEITAAQAELTQLLADYTSGVKKTDDVKKDYQRIGQTLKTLLENHQFLESKLSNSKVKLDSLQAAFNALPSAPATKSRK